MAEQAEGAFGSTEKELQRKATLRRCLGDAANKAGRKLDKLVTRRKELPTKILNKQKQAGEVQSEFETADAELFEAVNAGLLDGTVTLEQAFEYFEVPVEERDPRMAAYEAVLDGLRVGPYVVSDAEQGVVWGYLDDKPTPHMLYQDGQIVAGARVVLNDHDEQQMPAIIPPASTGSKVGEGLLSDREIWSYVLDLKPFSGGGIEMTLDLRKLVLAGRGLDALQFVNANPKTEDARYQAIEHGIESMIGLKEREDGSLALTRFNVPKVNGNVQEVAMAVEVMKKHFPVAYKKLYDNLAVCMAHEPDHEIKSSGTYNPSLALDMAAVMLLGSKYTQRQRFGAGVSMVGVGETLLSERGAK